MFARSKMCLYMYTLTHKNLACVHQGPMHRHVFSHGNIFMRVYVHACTSSRHRLALVAMEGIRKRRAVGRDVATIPLGFALWVSEWKPVSQSVRRAGKSMIGTGALLRAPLNDSCMIDAWLWIVTIEYVGSPLKKNEERRHIKFDSIGIL